MKKLFLALFLILAAFISGFFVGVRFDSNAELRHEEWRKFHGIGPLYAKEKQS